MPTPKEICISLFDMFIANEFVRRILYKRMNALCFSAYHRKENSCAVNFFKGQSDNITTKRSTDSIRCPKETMTGSELQKYYPRSRCYSKISSSFSCGTNIKKNYLLSRLLAKSTPHSEPLSHRS